ncbi:MAG TPA: RNA-binding domain-containing protein [Clostridium sp.]|uniref:RNA-binding domain-containing protein n=1 Tax=Clostridium sp. TaxID=1506 RepID=UPI002F93F2E8
MGLPINIEQLFNGTTIEWERIEFKKGWNPNEIMHTISAFANDINNWGGGYIVVGVDEFNGRPTLPPDGVEADHIDKIQKELLNYCHLLKPVYFPILEPLIYKGKHILVIWVPGGQNRPYECPKDFYGKYKEYKYYVRHFSNTIEAKDTERRELYNLAGNIPFDDRVCYNAEIEDLKLNLIREYLGSVKSDLYDRINDIPKELLCRQMNIVEGSQEYIKPKNIGILMFSNNPQKFMPMSQIELVYFENTSADDVFIEKTFTGPIHEQIIDTLKYIKNSIIKEKIIKLPDEAEAIRVFNYPYAALEEAIVNAVYHRSYEVREPIEIRIDAEKIIILNYPGPDKSIRKSDIDSGKVVARRYRNRRIGEFLKELKLTEGRSTGIPKIIKSMATNNSPHPIFDTDEDRSYFLVELPINLYFNDENKYQDKAQDKAQDDVYLQELKVLGLNETELKILQMLKTSIISKRQIAFNLGYKSITGNIKKAIRNLLDNKLIEYTIPNKSTSKNQKYKLR